MNELTIELVQSKLKIGDILNYIDICRILNVTYYSSGNQKKSQLKDFKRYFNFEKVNRKLLITEIYDDIKPKEPTERYTNYEQFLLNYEDGQKKGVYIIQKDNKVYIGSTIVSFRKRFLEHMDKKTKPIIHDMLYNGATFSALWFANENDEEYIIRNKEEQYIKYYSSLSQYDVVNTLMETYTKDLSVEQNRIYNNQRTKKNKSQKVNIPKQRYKSLKFKESDVEKIKRFCKENNIEYIDKNNSKEIFKKSPTHLLTNASKCDI